MDDQFEQAHPVRLGRPLKRDAFESASRFRILPEHQGRFERRHGRRVAAEPSRRSRVQPHEGFANLLYSNHQPCGCYRSVCVTERSRNWCILCCFCINCVSFLLFGHWSRSCFDSKERSIDRRRSQDNIYYSTNFGFDCCYCRVFPLRHGWSYLQTQYRWHSFVSSTRL